MSFSQQINAPLDEQFEQGIRIIRDAYQKRVSFYKRKKDGFQEDPFDPTIVDRITKARSKDELIRARRLYECPLWTPGNVASESCVVPFPATKLANKDAEVLHLRSESMKKDTEIKNYQLRTSQLEMQLSRADKRIAELTRSAHKLASFKQSVLQSFAEEDLEDVRDRVLNGAGGAAGTDAVDDILERVKGFGGSGEFLGGINFQDQAHPSPARTLENPASLDQLTQPFLASPPKYVSPSRYSSPPEHPVPSTMAIPNSTGGRPHQQSPHQKPPAYEGGSGGGRGGAGGRNTNATVLGTGVGGGGGGDETGGTPRPAGPKGQNTVDGREFFKTARSVLSYDEFTQLLTNVKAYNNREQSRHRTLENTRALLGTKHQDVFENFGRLLGVGAAGVGIGAGQ
ncbi:hypothetical protein HDU93_000630 [Gonapodya sp. JEL0774]|nr:hypothetical protein HDU93_000630 [Gonapodya sp. JEL0774]